LPNVPHEPSFRQPSFSQASFSQASFDELGTPLAGATFVVLDLETTGGSPAEHAITEIGAVKVRGGEVLGEFQTLVNPGEQIPAFVAVLTGITDTMVASAPRLAAALPPFLEFLRGCVVVAHNARFDVSFLRAACATTGQVWPDPTVIDTVHLARHVLAADEVRNCKLSTLAARFGSPVTPDHRALHDARATVHVLHALIGRLGNLGVVTIEELAGYSGQVPTERRRKRRLADGLPHSPGVYLFRDDRDRVLYVGTSVDIRTRVLSYFTRAEKRARMAEMLTLAHRVSAVVCETTLEARVRELRLIAEHAPRYNRRSRHPHRRPWVILTDEPFPRLSVVRAPTTGGAARLGPFNSRQQADLAIAALHEAFRLRQCGGRLPRRPAPGASACLLAELRRCDAPCIGGIDQAGYQQVVDAAALAMRSDARTVTAAVQQRVVGLAQHQRFEEAAVHRDRLQAFLAGARRAQRAAPLAASPELVAARRLPDGGWELVLVRHGRMAGSTRCPRGADPMPYVAALRAVAEPVQPAPGPQPAGLSEECEQVLAWLEQPGVRLVELDGQWSCPVHGAEGVALGPSLGSSRTTATAGRNDAKESA
jgi:DNA polymerase III subunit epsilon